LHLTLKFLGSTAPENAGLLADILEESANSFYRFVVELGDVGAFPNLRKPQTIWLGVERAEPLILLAEEIDRAVSSLGFEREARPFRPHLTLGRVRSPRGLRDLSQALLTPAEQPAVPTSWAVNEIELIRSELRPSGPVYTTLHRANLREGS
jgi:2'-5' RNA ligase